MCLVLFSWKSHSRFPLVLAANRDEFHQRPAAAAAFWDDQPDILAGRDLQADGTWLGVNRSGRLAALTNYREPNAPAAVDGRSRGFLVPDFLAGGRSPLDHAHEVRRGAESYSGFNLLLGDGRQLAWVSNRATAAREVAPGIHGLSNHLLNTDWPKVHVGKQRLGAAMGAAGADPDQLAPAIFEVLTDSSPVVGEIPETVEAGLTADHLARHFFIRSPVYGTRCSTVIVQTDEGDLLYEERRFSPAGEETGRSRFELAGM